MVCVEQEASNKASREIKMWLFFIISCGVKKGYNMNRNYPGKVHVIAMQYYIHQK